MKKLIAHTMFAAALLLLLVTAGRAMADGVEIKDVDNYAGNSNVYTDKPNTKVTINELGYNGDVVNTWTGTTDAQGKITIPAGHNLSKPYLRARLASENQSGSENQSASVEGIVVPDSLSGGQPFSFSVPQVAGKEVDIQSATGEVVQQVRTDRYGRVFLSAGLPAGAYLISLASGSARQPIGQINIGEHHPGLDHPTLPIQVHDAPQAVKCYERFSLRGQGFSPNYGDMQVSLSAAGHTTTASVLAATEDQLKLAPAMEAQPGVAMLKVTNQATGQHTEASPLLLYEMEGHIRRNQLSSGRDQTQLVVNMRPENIPLQIQAEVVSGPVDFGGGRKETVLTTSNGLAIFAVHAEHGAGPFQLNWMLATPRITILPCLINGIKCDTAFYRAVSWKLNWLKEIRDVIEKDSNRTDKEKEEAIKKLDDEKDTILGKDLKKSWDTVKANLERRLATAKSLKERSTTGDDIVYWNDRIKEIQKLIDDMDKEGAPK